jgi:UDPglucose 6-dehydrogenase
MKIGFLGMSHLGIISSIAAAKKGFSVLALDTNSDLIKLLSEGKFPISEPDLNDFYDVSRSRIEFTEDFSKVSDCELVYISIDVVTSHDGTSDLTNVRNLVDLATQHLKVNSCLVILCQVPPGFTREVSTLTKSHVYHQVETLVFGNAFECALNPERIIIGAKDKEKVINHSLYNFLLSFNCSIIKLDYETSEFCKICINIVLASSITAANTLAELCEHIGASWNDIQRALRMDQRIGAKAYLSAGLGISGGNIERDIKTSLELSRKLKANHELLEAVCSHSQQRKLWPSQRLSDVLTSGLEKATIAIWGVAYKRNTHSTKNSPSLANMRNLPESIRFNLHDSWIEEIPGFSERHVTWFKNKYDALNGADALMILTDWSEYSYASLGIILSRLAKPIIIDPYRVIEELIPENVHYFTLGESPLTRGYFNGS